MVLGILGDIANNLGALPEDIILLVTCLSGLVFMAVNLKLSMVLLLLIFSVEYIVFRMIGFDTFKVYLAILATILILALSLYTTKTEQI